MKNMKTIKEPPLIIKASFIDESDIINSGISIQISQGDFKMQYPAAIYPGEMHPQPILSDELLQQRKEVILKVAEMFYAGVVCMQHSGNNSPETNTKKVKAYEDQRTAFNKSKEFSANEKMFVNRFFD